MSNPNSYSRTDDPPDADGNYVTSFEEQATHDVVYDVDDDDDEHIPMQYDITHGSSGDDNKLVVYNQYDMDTDKISSDDDIQPPPSQPNDPSSSDTGSHAASFFRNSLRRLPSFGGGNNHTTATTTAAATLPYDHRNSLIRSITTTAAATLERRYSVAELVHTLNRPTTTTTSTTDNNNDNNCELERRVLDFQLAQKKRHEKYGVRRPFGIFGMYNHLANVRIDLEWAEDAAYRRQHNEPYLSWTDFDDARMKTLSRPYFTYIIFVVCTIMLVVEFAVNDWKIEPLSVNPMIGPSAETLIALGARVTDLIVNNNEWFRIFTPMILHAGIIHYIVNMAAVLLIGIAIEQNHGWVKSCILFMIPGVGGTILSAIFLPQNISVGASGGIFGLVGGCIADLLLHWNLLFIQVLDETPKQVYRRNFFAVAILIIEILFNIVLGLITPVIDNFAHLGGMIYGICCAFTTIDALSASGFFGGVQTSTFEKVRTSTIKFCGLIVSIALILVTTVWLATTSDATKSPCSGCRYISCIPMPLFAEDKWWYCDDCDFVTAVLEKNSTFSDYYSQIELTCPDDSIETIDIGADLITENDDVRKRLPTYCRDHCSDVFN